MIDPIAIADVDAATDEEILEALRAEGVSEPAAQFYLDAIRDRLPPGTIVD